MSNEKVMPPVPVAPNVAATELAELRANTVRRSSQSSAKLCAVSADLVRATEERARAARSARTSPPPPDEPSVTARFSSLHVDGAALALAASEPKPEA